MTTATKHKTVTFEITLPLAEGIDPEELEFSTGSHLMDMFFDLGQIFDGCPTPYEVFDLSRAYETVKISEIQKEVN